MHRLKYFHLGIGIAGLIAFVITGQYMAIFLNGLQGMPDGPRLLYRSAHLYLMWSALINLSVGVRFPPLRIGAARIAQIIASIMLLVTPLLILIGFAVEARFESLSRPFCQLANYFALAGVLLHVIASRESGVSSADTRK